jgi:hypothetical protein
MARVRITVEYTPVMPAEYADEYKSVPQTKSFEFDFKCENEKNLETWAKYAVLRELLKREEVCEMIKMLDLELC